MPSAPAHDLSVVKRRAFFALLYFSEGAPIGYVWWAMPTRLCQAGMPVEEVASLIGLLTLPWALKFLWAPAIDRLRGPRWGYRSWITLAQLIMGISLLPLISLNPDSVTTLATVFLLLHAFSAATQDVAIDAMAIASIPEAERGRTNGWMQAGMLVGRGTFGGLALAAESWIGAEGVIFALVGCIWITLALVWLVPLEPVNQTREKVTRSVFVSALKRVLKRPSTWLGFGVALTAGAGFEAVGGLIGPFLIDRGLSKEAIGWFFAIPVIGLMILGAMLGGYAADRLGHLRLVKLSVLAVGACIVALIYAEATLEIRGTALLFVASPLYLFIGSLTASSYTLFMDLTDPELGGTQFSAYMGATNFCEVWAVALAGWAAGLWSYAAGFMACAGLSLIALAFLPALRKNTAAQSPR